MSVPCAWEAASMGRSVDLAFLHGEEVWTVEFKKRDWRRALAQARDHMLAADYAYICLPEGEPSDAFVEAAREMGVGILGFEWDGDWPFNVIAPAQRSQDTWIVARERLIQQLTSN